MAQSFRIPPQIIAVWNPGGNSTASFSYEISLELKKYTSVFLVELPCLGIPRLGFLSGIWERDNCTDTIIADYTRKNEINWSCVHQVEDSLAISPASVYALPDCPVVQRAELEQLISFTKKIIDKAQEMLYEVIVIECQGQLTTPMTFCALNSADRVILPLENASEFAFSLINIRRLIQAFRFNAERFLVVTKENVEAVREIMSLYNETDGKKYRISVVEEEPKNILKAIGGQNQELATKSNLVNIVRGLQKRRVLNSCETKKNGELYIFEKIKL